MVNTVENAGIANGRKEGMAHFALLKEHECHFALA
jgi:hypothetical protein